MADSSGRIQVENVVASTEINQELDLSTLADDLSAAQYDPDQFPGLVYRTQEPEASVLVFRSGKIVTTGAQKKSGVHDALGQLFEELGGLGIDVPGETDPTVQNMVTSGDLGEGLNLNAIAIGLGLETTEYEPEQFPGLVYRLDELSTVTLLFGSGKLVITGAISRDEATETFNRVQSQLEDLELIN